MSFNEKNCDGTKKFFIFLAVLVTLTAFFLVYFEKITIPRKEAKQELAGDSMLLALTIKNISLGCQKKGESYVNALPSQQMDLIRLADKIKNQKIAQTREGNKDLLGPAGRKQLDCLVNYARSLMSRPSSICNGDFYSKDEMMLWGRSIVHSIQKGDSKITKTLSIDGFDEPCN